MLLLRIDSPDTSMFISIIIFNGNVIFQMNRLELSINLNANPQ